ncbi:MAG: plastocyanin/azurin family copper-binding protein [Nitrososphaera sp.]|nr:plastocyanin/azurin family copper-binding protein [Nitrososphaera sp.]
MLHTVTIKDFAFSPQALTIKIGDSVKWRNADGTKHSARHASAPIFDTGLLSPGEESKIITFDEAVDSGISYHCEPHPHMQGTITVTCQAYPHPSQEE